MAARARLRQVRRGRLLDDLLVTALQSAVAFTEVDHRAVLVPEDLDLDVPGLADVPLQVQPPVAERGVGLSPGPGQRARRTASSSITDIPRPPPPAAALISTG